MHRSNASVWLGVRIISVLFGLLTAVVAAPAQGLELRHVFESFRDMRIQIGAGLLGPVHQPLDPHVADELSEYRTTVTFNGLVSAEYYNFRGGIAVSSVDAVHPFLFWNPVIPGLIGGESSRWSASLGWESALIGNDQSGDILQSDNSVYDPGHSFSALLGFWAGTGLSSDAEQELLRASYPGMDSADLEHWIALRSGKALRYHGHGYPLSMASESAGFDSLDFVRGVPMPLYTPVAYSARQGFSAAVGLGSGKYAGSGPLSSIFNFGTGSGARHDDSVGTEAFGINPLASLRYRLGNYIAQLDVAGEDINFAVVARSLKNLDLEIGFRSLEHAIPRSSRGIYRPEFFVTARYFLPLRPGMDRIETGESVFYMDDDADGDGVPNDVEIHITKTDPASADSDGDGLADGLEVYTYLTDPRNRDSDGDAVADGVELLGRNQRSDPLFYNRPDGDSDSRKPDQTTPEKDDSMPVKDSQGKTPLSKKR